MKIAFLGDIHGRIFHALTVLVKWQQVHGEKLDLIIQAGDLGAYPYPDEKLLSNKFVRQDPTELDFSRFIAGGDEVESFLQKVGQELAVSVYFIRGNHEDFNWLKSLTDNGDICDVDKNGILKYIKDGTVKKMGDTSLGFLGGAEFGAKGDGVLDIKAYTSLMESKEEIDILVTHDTHFGIGFSYHGLTQGSQYITELVQKIQPDFHITAHYHHMIGPHYRHNTTHVGLNNIVLPLRGKPGRHLRPGWMMVMDTDTKQTTFVKDAWLTEMTTLLSVDELINIIK